MRRLRIGSIQVAAMLAALLLSAGLVMRISATLSPVAPETRTGTAAERAIEVRNDLAGQTMFEGVALAPGESVRRCITVSATGTRVPERVIMQTTDSLDAGLGPWLHMDVVRGTGTGLDCAAFEPDSVVLSGPAIGVVQALDRGMPWTPAVSEVVPGGHATTYAFVAKLAPDAPNEVMGRRLAFDLAWSTYFEATGGSVFERTFALAVRFTQDSMIPMLFILSIAIMFLGIQNRLDGATPELTHAALSDDVITFAEV